MAELCFLDMHTCCVCVHVLVCADTTGGRVRGCCRGSEVNKERAAQWPRLLLLSGSVLHMCVYVCWGRTRIYKTTALCMHTTAENINILISYIKFPSVPEQIMKYFP